MVLQTMLAFRSNLAAQILERRYPRAIGIGSLDSRRICLRMKADALIEHSRFLDKTDDMISYLRGRSEL